MNVICGHKVDIYYLTKAARFILPLCFCTAKWEKFEILLALSAKAQSQQVIWRIMLDGVSSRATQLHQN